MSVKGIGVDIERVDRIAHLIQEYDDEVLQMIFTPYELEQCKSDLSGLSYAVCFSAKEATAKALGTGFATIEWTDIEIHIEMSRVFVRLHNEALQIANENNIKNIMGCWSSFDDHVLVHLIAEG
ncbi:holo-ACP synthase [Laceyella sacchari]|jgi:holo-[acyl-carrier protein] synthase|uniref:4'-phosphopantetheinyl transferase superfamily protein n=1 Tax=Laceyella sacchari TaxID=37482 RepID=A0ABY5U4W7_LACSH|nr:4'-phosphopantetheinyl transferase superfamily protein [Laceyella sacchari]KPC72472.1 hypothetical protein ADL26_13990 [Thermoactinomyces vulgaris]TCW38983.1 holo-[acyl-carrier-protein] synthase [Laceyella sacchari]UWE03317.1 4'-phosphopantetheinyl transferase superfamily protein [Laceyella sacchari]UYO72937.1 TheI [Laceyella sacchari]